MIVLAYITLHGTDIGKLGYLGAVVRYLPADAYEHAGDLNHWMDEQVFRAYTGVALEECTFTLCEERSRPPRHRSSKARTLALAAAQRWQEAQGGPPCDAEAAKDQVLGLLVELGKELTR